MLPLTRLSAHRIHESLESQHRYAEKRLNARLKYAAVFLLALNDVASGV